MRNANNLTVLATYNRHRICFNRLPMKMCLLYVKFGAMDARESIKLSRKRHTSWMTLLLHFCIPAHPVSHVSTWSGEQQVDLTAPLASSQGLHHLTSGRQPPAVQCLTYTTNSTLEFLMKDQFNVDVQD